MAPKKPPPAPGKEGKPPPGPGKEGKPPPGPGKEDPKKPPEDEKDKTKFQKLVDRVKAFLNSPKALYMAVITDVIIFAIAIMYIVYAMNEWQKTATLRRGMRILKAYMISRDKSYETKEDVETILEADMLAKELAMWAAKLNELEAELDNVRYRLNHDWFAYNSALYVMEDYGATWEKVKGICKKEKAELVKIEDEAEQIFLYKQVKGRHTPYWLGLRAEDDKWTWDIDATEPPTKYWLENHPPYDLRKPGCALMSTNCPSSKKCWMAATCGRIGRVLCKMKPQEKWMK